MHGHLETGHHTKANRKQVAERNRRGLLQDLHVVLASAADAPVVVVLVRDDPDNSCPLREPLLPVLLAVDKAGEKEGPRLGRGATELCEPLR